MPNQADTRILECLRLEQACRELAGRVGHPDLQSHFVRMGEVWNGLAEEALAGATAEPLSAAARRAA